MKRRLISILVGSLLCAAMIFSLLMPLQPAEAAEVTLTILNPKGNIETVQVPPLAKRVDTLEGKKIGLWFYSKDSSAGINARSSLVNLLSAEFPTANIFLQHSKGGVWWPEPNQFYESTARESDVTIFGVAN